MDSLLEKCGPLLSFIDEAKLADLCSRLIQFRTPNPPGNEAEAAGFLGNLLRTAGFQVEIFPHSPHRASLVARLRSTGELPALIFSGHLDVGSQTDEEWKYDPFGGQILDGKVWGRGASDMKGGVASIVHAATILAAAHYPLKGDLILALTAGEENGFIGAKAIVNRYDFGPIQALFIAEPSDNDVVIAEKGLLWLEISTHGKAIHMAQMDQGRNAIMMMLPLLINLLKIEFPFVEHPLLGKFVYSINSIHAGMDVNTLPDRCVVQVDLRTVPGQDHAAIVNEIQDLLNRTAGEVDLPGFQATSKVLLDAPPLATPPDNPVIKRFFEIVTLVTGKHPQPQAVAAGTDAVAFVPALKIPFLMCGPGNPLFVHHVDENVEIAKLVDSTKIYLLSAVEFLSE